MKTNLFRRGFLRSSMLTGASLSLLSRSTHPVAAAQASRPGEAPAALTEKQFREGILPLAELSLAASQLAVTKAENPKIRRFANFELEETTAITEVLREMGTTPPEPAQDRQASLEKLEKAAGKEFDHAYLKAQLATHIALRELATAYLESPASGDPAEKHGRHLAKIALPAFKEHTAVCGYLAESLGG